MNTQTTVQVRIDTKTKRAAERTLGEMGLDLSSGMRLFLRNVAITQTIPFQVRTINGFTPEEERQMLKEGEEARKSGRKFSSGKALLQSIK
ncbi:MAG: hypothetical protein COV07_04230 [Candidatus Vogelbacteria bacterium CG10_big_fil_rev_8_21_14_0_10_45_14]|uniref:Type II toxin-antitoxin system antitoxin, RelB/DinJ family n=1 Tax=Candidatus Vogelbacteria bacterium CG10_big_fil_rev_8_21_14_0_10_45_14 TaxID=1975042 RepID=A0A2H0RIF6_9BACT|nr:MAG: hypothetical protein COV07_04230 [Candidatus Vogelbacteria bacterium CG10_big_fil_rev_8_21_14_0_10_45_14]